MPDYSHGADSLAAGLLAAGQGIGGGLREGGIYQRTQAEEERKAQTLADLINAAQTQFAGYDENYPEGPMSGVPAPFEQSYPDLQNLPPELQKGAARYGLLDTYLNLKKGLEPQYKIEGNSIIKFPAGGQTPTVVGELPTKNAKDRVFLENYQNFIATGMKPDAAFQRSMELLKAGEVKVQGIKEAGATGRNEATNASRERIAKMGDATKRFVGQLNHDARVRAAEISSGSKNKAKLSVTIPSYPGSIGGSNIQMRYEANPNDPTSLQTVYDKINTRISSVDEMARKSGLKGVPETFFGVNIPLTETKKKAQGLWNDFVSQFSGDGIYSTDNPSVDDMRRILNAQNRRDGGDGTLYDDADEQTLSEEFANAQNNAIGYDELPGDMQLMGQEYVNDITFKRHLEDTYGLAPAIAPQGGGGGPIENMRQKLREYAKQNGGNADNVDVLSDEDIQKAYDEMLKRQK